MIGGIDRFADVVLPATTHFESDDLAASYGAFVLGVWTGPGSVPPRARRFAFWSAIGALALGVAAQVIVHLLIAAHRTAAPWPVTMLVSCMPVVVLGFSAALIHLLRSDPAGTVPGTVPAPGLNGHAAEAERLFAAELEAGRVPGMRRIRAGLHIGNDRAALVRDHLRARAGHG